MATDSTIPTGTPRGVPETAIEELRAALNGELLVGVDAVREVFNAMHPSAAEMTVNATGTSDVIAAVRFAREHDLEITVRGGGHSIAGLSAARGGMLIDLAAMNAVQIDPVRKLAHAQGGALWADVDREGMAFGLTTPGGVVSDTGIAGLTLGGGYGWLRRKHGLSCDSLVEAQVVDASGNVLTASEEADADLLWALRGGGGNFGVVTSMTFQLYDVGPEVAFSATFYPLEEAATVMRGWREFTKSAPDEVTSVCVTVTFPANPEMPPQTHDRKIIIVGAVHAGPDIQAGLDATAPLRSLAEPLFDMSGPTPWIGVQTGFDGLFPRNTLRAYWKAGYLDELTDEALDTIVAKAQARPAPLTLVNTFHMGGAIAKVDPEATAFAHREPEYLFSIDGLWDDAASDAANVDWVRQTFADIGAFGTGGVYLNFTGEAGEALGAGVDDAFGRNLARLEALKAKYDPDNVFRRNNNIAPAAH